MIGIEITISRNDTATAQEDDQQLLDQVVDEQPEEPVQVAFHEDRIVLRHAVEYIRSCPGDNSIGSTGIAGRCPSDDTGSEWVEDVASGIQPDRSGGVTDEYDNPMATDVSSSACAGVPCHESRHLGL